MKRANMLEARAIVAGYGPLDILHGASVSLDQGEVVTVIGPNGAGKSTFLKAVFGLIKVRSGAVKLMGREVTNMPPNRLVESGLAYVPQVANVFPNLTVHENLEVGGFLRAEDVEPSIARVEGLFPVLKERKGEKVGRMSGGERQMVAIGRALVAEPKVLLLDEPSAGLAPRLQEIVFSRIRQIAAGGVPVLLVEQNAKRSLAMSDRGYVFDQGETRFEGKGPELLADERVASLYLGKR